MFHGSLPDSVQQIMGDCIRDWKCTDIYVGCSGNFTIERMLKGVTNARLHGNDVTIYSCLLGRYFSGAPLNARFNENYEGPMEFIQEYMKTDLDIATCVLLLSKMSTYLGSKPNPYYVRMIEAYKDQWPELFDKTRTKLEKAGQFLDSFYAGDVIGWVDDVPKDQGFVCYPPFYSGDYEKMFKVIEGIIAWDPPEYDMIDKDKIFEMFRKLTERDYFMFGTNDELEEFSDYLMGISQTTNRGVPLYVYSKAPKSRHHRPAPAGGEPDGGEAWEGRGHRRHHADCPAEKRELPGAAFAVHEPLHQARQRDCELRGAGG